MTVRLKAPHGGAGSSFSHNGVEHKVPDDGIVEVDHPTAEVLRSHGFVDEAQAHLNDAVVLKRHEIIDVLSALGVVVTGTVMSAAQLAEAMKDAAKAVAKGQIDDIAKGADAVLGDEPAKPTAAKPAKAR